MVKRGGSQRSFLVTRPALLYFSSDLCSTFGRYALFLALAVWVQQRTGSASLAGATAAFVMLGSLTSPVSGVLVDRMPPRRALRLPLVATACLLATLLVHDGYPILPFVYVVGFLYGAVGSMGDSAQTVVLAELFSDEQLLQANALNQTLARGLRTVAPLTGVALYALTGIRATVILAASCYLVAAFLATLIPMPTSADEADRPPAPGLSVASILHDMWRGMRLVWDAVPVRNVVFASASALFFLNFFETVGLKVVTQGLHQPSTELAPLISVQGVATIAAGFALTKFGKRFTPPSLMLGGLLCFAASALLQTSGQLWLVILAMVVAGAGLPLCIVSMVTTVQSGIPKENLGKAFGAVSFIISAPQAVGAVVGAGLVAILDYRLVCLLIAIGLGFTALALLLATTRQEVSQNGPVKELASTDVS